MQNLCHGHSRLSRGRNRSRERVEVKCVDDGGVDGGIAGEDDIDDDG